MSNEIYVYQVRIEVSNFESDHTIFEFYPDKDSAEDRVKELDADKDAERLISKIPLCEAKRIMTVTEFEAMFGVNCDKLIEWEE